MMDDIKILPVPQSCFLFVFILGSLAAASTTGSETYNPPGTLLHCLMCPKGNRVSNHCKTDLAQSECQLCDAHTYMANPNSNTHCIGCKLGNCPRNGVEVQTCTNQTDRLCICQPGYHRYPLDPIDPQFECMRHSVCGPGEGVTSGGNHTHDRQCKPCEEGKAFLNVTDPERPVCQDCSSCTEGTHETLRCTLHNDTQCGHGNATSAPEVTTTSPPVSDVQSQSLPIGVIFVIVWGFLVVVGAIAAVVLYHILKCCDVVLGNRCKVSLVVGVISGLGLLVVLVLVLHFLCGCCQERRPPTPVPEEVHLTSAESNHEAGTNGAVPNGVSAQPLRNPQGDGDQGAHADLHWSSEFIHRKVFLSLTDELGVDWEQFIHALPGWPSATIIQSGVIEPAKLNNVHSAKNQIMACLEEWRKQCTEDDISKTSICEALGVIGKREVIERLKEKHVIYLKDQTARSVSEVV